MADLVLGEPPPDLHPVRLFGRTMRAVEAGLYRDSRGAGVAHAAIGLMVGALAGAAVRSTASAVAVAAAARGLASAAHVVADALEDGDLAAARDALPTLCGRDPTLLDEKGIARAVVESVAENTVDAVVAPALWGAAAGAPGAWAYRAVNTMDAMVGHRSPRYTRYGWACARLDDLAAFVPARATAALVAAVRPRRAAVVVEVVRRDARAHPSPNAGVAEAAFAAALDLRLGSEIVYDGRRELRPTLGHGRTPEPADIRRATRLSRDVTLALAAALAVAAVTAPAEKNGR